MIQYASHSEVTFIMSALNELQYDIVVAQKTLIPDQKDLGPLEANDKTQRLQGESEDGEVPVSTSRFITCVTVTDSN